LLVPATASSLRSGCSRNPMRRPSPRARSRPPPRRARSLACRCGV